MVYSSVIFAVEHHSWEAIWSIAILLVGVVMSFYELIGLALGIHRSGERP